MLTSTQFLIKTCWLSHVDPTFILKYFACQGATQKTYKCHSLVSTALEFSFNDMYLVAVGGTDGTPMQWRVVTESHVDLQGNTSNLDQTAI